MNQDVWETLCSLIWIFPNSSATLLNILKIPHTPPSLKNAESMTMQIFFIWKALRLEARCLVLHWQVSVHVQRRVCISRSHLWPWLVPDATRCYATKPFPYAHVLNSQIDFHPSADEFENSLLVSDSAHSSLCTVQLRHACEVTISKTHFWASPWTPESWLQPSEVMLEKPAKVS